MCDRLRCFCGFRVSLLGSVFFLVISVSFFCVVVFAVFALLVVFGFVFFF